MRPTFVHFRVQSSGRGNVPNYVKCPQTGEVGEKPQPQWEGIFQRLSVFSAHQMSSSWKDPIASFDILSNPCEIMAGLCLRKDGG